MAGILIIFLDMNRKYKIQQEQLLREQSRKKGCGPKRAGANRKQGLTRGIAHEIKKKERKNRIIKHSKFYLRK